MEIKPKYYFKKIEDFPIPDLFKTEKVWEILKKKDEFLSKLKTKVDGKIDPDCSWHGTIHVGKGTKIGKKVIIEGPVWIGENCKIGPNTYIRKGTIIGNDCELGGIEIKGSILMNKIKAHHHGYIGDSIIGDSVNVGAGTVLTNFRFDGKTIAVGDQDTKLRKIGAFIGDNVSIGCNSVTVPGVGIGPNTWIYPLCLVRQFVPEDSVLKHKPTHSVESRW